MYLLCRPRLYNVNTWTHNLHLFTIHIACHEDTLYNVNKRTYNLHVQELMSFCVYCTSCLLHILFTPYGVFRPFISQLPSLCWASPCLRISQGRTEKYILEFEFVPGCCVHSSTETKELHLWCNNHRIRTNGSRYQISCVFIAKVGLAVSYSSLIAVYNPLSNPSFGVVFLVNSFYSLCTVAFLVHLQVWYLAKYCCNTPTRPTPVEDSYTHGSLSRGESRNGNPEHI